MDSDGFTEIKYSITHTGVLPVARGLKRYISTTVEYTFRHEFQMFTNIRDFFQTDRQWLYNEHRHIIYHQ